MKEINKVRVSVVFEAPIYIDELVKFGEANDCENMNQAIKLAIVRGVKSSKLTEFWKSVVKGASLYTRRTRYGKKSVGQTVDSKGREPKTGRVEGN